MASKLFWPGTCEECTLEPTPPAADGTHTDASKGALPAKMQPQGASKEALYSLGFNQARSLVGHVAMLQHREDEMALVRDRQRSVGILLLETWLNDVLTSSLPSKPPLDLLQAQPVARHGLRAFGIDRPALLGAGLGDAAVSRLFRGIYVYSVGFSDMLRVRSSRSQRRRRIRFVLSADENKNRLCVSHR